MNVSALRLIVPILWKEAFQQLHPAGFVLSQLVNLVLSINVDAGQQVSWEEGGNFIVRIKNNRLFTVTP